MNEKKPARRRIGLIIIAGFAILLIATLVWYYLPLNLDFETRLETYDVVGYFEADLSPDEGVGAFALSLVESRFVGEDAGGFRRAGFRIASSAAFPDVVSGWLIHEPGETLPGVIGVVQFGRAVRALKMVHRVALPRVLFDGRARTERVGSYRLRTVADGQSATPVAAYTFIGDSFVFSTSRAALSSLLHVLAEDSMVVRPDVVAGLDSLDAPVRLYLANDSDRLTSVVRGVEERVAFAALPSADALTAIASSFQIEAGQAGGNELLSDTQFIYHDPSRAREVYSDARFLYGALRRVARSQEIDLRGEVSDADSVVRLQLTAAGLERLLAPPAADEAPNGDG